MQLLFSVISHKKSQKKIRNLLQHGKEKDSFLVQKYLSKISITISSITGRISPRSSKKRATSCISPRGSVTIEAALVTPLFLYGILCIVFLLEILAVQMSVRTSMHGVYQNLAQEMYLMSYISVNEVEEQIVEGIGATKLDNSIVVNGSQGLDCSNSCASLATGIITLQVDYQVGLPFPAFLNLGLNFSETLMGKG